ncbi:MAG TPA: hypothetical protein VGZ00_04515 [Candidatus Baltobacteraceae bacterium]|nr:hypothetical protein [Candidatus Baltobacteraceae bacterium]
MIVGGLCICGMKKYATYAIATSEISRAMKAGKARQHRLTKQDDEIINAKNVLKNAFRMGFVRCCGRMVCSSENHSLRMRSSMGIVVEPISKANRRRARKG